VDPIHLPGSLGQSALLARRLAESGSRFVTAAGFHSSSWDTHARNDQGHKDRLSPVLDKTLSALLDGLDQRGLLETTVGLAMGEFGRATIHKAVCIGWTKEYDTPIGRPIKIANSLEDQPGKPIAELL